MSNEINLKNTLFDSFDKEKQQNIPFIKADVNNVAQMLPMLFKGQQKNVALAEKRFMEGKGVMFTDGTGTGKTFTGLGIAYRFFVQNKKDILIVVPTDNKCLDWIKEGRVLGLDIYQIKNTKDPGIDISVTTYANFYQNEAMLHRLFHLIIYDESHYLGQNMQGVETSYYEQHKIVANLPSASLQKAHEIHSNIKPEYSNSDSWYEMQQYYDKIISLTAERFIVSTKVVFLSATPFAYHKSIKYADGTLIEITEKKDITKKVFKSTSHNAPCDWGQFLISNFGYQMKYNKITIPDTGVDKDLLERNFFETMKEKGIMSTQVLSLEKDYSREFITLDSELGDFINSGLELFHKDDFKKTFPILCEKYGKKYNYMYVNQLLECIKAREVLPRIQQHLDLGRKIVIFHSYNHALVDHPFRFDVDKLLDKEELYMTPRLLKEIENFEKFYSKYFNLDLSHLKNTRDTIINQYPGAKEFNGTVPKKKRTEYYKDFNDDNGNTFILLVQQKAGKEGISLHDKTGKYQRVLIQLGLPTEPTGCIQIEGRTYREGVKTNAPYEYMTLQTSFEQIAFGQTIAKRSRTAENLAMGNLARNLEESFKEGYLASSYNLPSLEQGIGGKEADKFVDQITPFDKAITYYYQRQKRTSKNKSSEDHDYFATPEPLGFKMVEWCRTSADQRGLEPSAGHGAIARFFPKNTNNHFIEPSIKLSGELSINSFGVVKIDSFENHSFINKYDFICMNPPFGTSGKTAMEHLEKALLKHTDKDGAVIMAIVPQGPAMGERITKFLSDPNNAKQFYIRVRIRLPNCLFARAGTTVATNLLQIVKINSYHYNVDRKTRVIDMAHFQNINDFFEEIRDLSL